MDPSQLLEWQNLIYVLPFAAGVFLTLLQAVGGMHFGHGAHLHIGHHHIGGHHVDATGHAHHGDPGVFAKFFSLLGLGKVPFMIGLTCFCYTWGFTGVVANQFLSKILPSPVLYIAPSVVATFVVASTITGSIARVFQRLMPRDETYAPSELDMVGEVATAYTSIDAKSGFVALLDEHFNRIELRCLTEEGVIPRGTKVVITRYDEEKRKFVVGTLASSIGDTQHPPQLH